MKGYVHLNVKAGTHPTVLFALEALKPSYPAIKDVDLVYGTFDIMLVIDARDEEEFVRTLSVVTLTENVTATSTFVVMSKEIVKKR